MWQKLKKGLKEQGATVRVALKKQMTISASARNLGTKWQTLSLRAFATVCFIIKARIEIHTKTGCFGNRFLFVKSKNGLTTTHIYFGSTVWPKGIYAKGNFRGHTVFQANGRYCYKSFLYKKVFGLNALCLSVISEGDFV